MVSEPLLSSICYQNLSVTVDPDANVAFFLVNVSIASNG